MSVAPFESLAQRDPYRFGNGPGVSLQPGTLGWTADDLRDPKIRLLWDSGRYEIIQGVLTLMPPARFRGGTVVDNLKFILRAYFRERGVRVAFSGEVDIAVEPSLVLRADGVAVVGDDLNRFDAQRFDPPDTEWKDNPLTLPPTIVIESISRGHELHDRVSKRTWYAGFGVPHYWIVNAYAKTLECLRLEGPNYVRDAVGKGDDVLKLSALPGLQIRLRDVWEDEPQQPAPRAKRRPRK